MDYSRMKATKVEKQKPKSIKLSKKDLNSTEKKVKKLGISWIIILIFLVVGIGAGFLSAMLITKNDTYEMVTYANGSADVYIGKDEEVKKYVELGVKCVAFGKDCSSNFKVTYFYRAELTEKEVEVQQVDETKEGIYYAVYTSPSKKYASVKLIRNIYVLKEEDDG